MRVSILLTAAVCLSIPAGTTPFVRAEEKLRISPGHNLLTETDPDAVPAEPDRLKAVSFRDLAGKEYYLEDLCRRGPVAFVFLATECPLAQRYAMRLRRLHEILLPRGVSLFGVFSTDGLTRQDLTVHAKEMDYPFPVVLDAHGYLARRLGATMTPQAFVVDSEGTVRYCGAIDDHRYEDRVKHRYLSDALTALLAKEPVRMERTAAMGCSIHLPTAATAEQVTYTKHIARIVQDHCQVCHRPGQVGPFALTSYEKVRTWSREIKEYTQARLMPPWKAEPGFGAFQHERRLSGDEIALLARWADEGTPRGDAADLPPAPRFSDDWALGKPDHVLEMPDEYEIGPEGEDDYRHFIIPTNFEGDVYVQAVDVRPGNRKAVHHVIAYVDTTGKARELDAADPGPGYTRFGDPGFEPASTLALWAPGTTPLRLPEGTGRLLPKGADIVLQVHYYHTGKVEKDRTRFGLYVTKAAEPKRVHLGAALNRDFTIPAGAQRHEVRAEMEVKEPVYAVSVYPHMHRLGKDIKVTAELPDGQTLPLIWIRNWDFNWQTGYPYQKPLFLPKGTRVRVVGLFDNSADNPNNPNSPPREVRWGEKTTDEMCMAFVEFLRAADYPVKPPQK